MKTFCFKFSKFVFFKTIKVYRENRCGWFYGSLCRYNICTICTRVYGLYCNTAQLSIISMKLHNRQVVMVVGFYEWAYCYAGQIMTLSAKIILYYTQYNIPSIIIQYGFTLAFWHLIKNIILRNCPSTVVRFGYSHYLYDCVYI